MDKSWELTGCPAPDSQTTLPQARHRAPVGSNVSDQAPADHEARCDTATSRQAPTPSSTGKRDEQQGGTSLDRRHGHINKSTPLRIESRNAGGQGSSSGRVDGSRTKSRRNTLDQDPSPGPSRQQGKHSNASKVPVQFRDTSTRAGANNFTANLIEAGGNVVQSEESTLDEGFAKRAKPRKFFTKGQVFLTLWTEPNSGDGSSITGISQTQYGETAHSKIRRFVVVTEAEYHCIAVPIGTYGGRGVAKRGVNKSEHAIVHTGRIAPEPRHNEIAPPDEVGLLPEAIRINVDDRTEKLDPMSRLNLGKLYTIEHYVKVRSFGHVHPSSMQPLTSQFQKVWAGNMGFDHIQTSTSAASSKHDSVISPMVSGRTDAETLHIARTELEKLHIFTPEQMLMLKTRLAHTPDYAELQSTGPMPVNDVQSNGQDGSRAKDAVG